ncbi:MAG TPA: GNAT family N-acetyltransferase [Polyangiaceae bacterium]|nr:GNAT family N-acetyltransferase [Polyangiaceae bacterium]
MKSTLDPDAGVVLRLRGVTPSDLEVFFEHQREPAANALAAFPARARDEFYAHWTEAMTDPETVLRTIVFQGRIAGNIVSWRALEERCVGYWLGQAFWGKGIATRALRALCAEVEERPLYAYVALHNAGSRRVLEKCDFAMLGKIRVAPAADSEPQIEEYVLRLDVRG